jgi:hypothetical protein
MIIKSGCGFHQSIVHLAQLFQAGVLVRVQGLEKYGYTA